MERKAVSSRSGVVIGGLASRLAAMRVTPNQLSVFSVIASLLVPAGLLAIGGPAGALLAIVGIQLRLLARLLDGLVATEQGAVPGSLCGELSDRLSDSIVLVPMGYAAQSLELGWLCALLAALAAHVRVLGAAAALARPIGGQTAGPMGDRLGSPLGDPTGGSTGGPIGDPMAGRYRMVVATVTLAVVACAPLVPEYPLNPSALRLGLIVIAVGTVWTCWSRARIAAVSLAQRSAQ